VVDALRMKTEFDSGEKLERENIEEDDIESLLIQQIEFCNTILLNKASEVSPEDIAKLKHIINVLNPGVEIICCDYADVDVARLVNTRGFDFEKVALSPAWVGLFDKPLEEIEDEEEGETDEYGISTFVYYRRPAFDYNKFDSFVAKKWPKSVIRAKGICYFNDSPDMSYLFEQSGVQKIVKEAGQWLVTAPADELRQMAEAQPQILNDFDPEYGDRMIKIVFIGQNMDKEQICNDLDFCLAV
ncbi:MAG: GTP-binding protein, partial [Bacteroidaceae bacterium]|nr:GTP-binding protein [Bacteroidaceae bacterium]